MEKNNETPDQVPEDTTPSPSADGEGQLGFSDAKYRALIEGSSDFIYVLDKEGRFIFANREVEHLLGYSPEEILGKHFSEVMHPNDVETLGHSFAERRTGQRATHRLEVRLASRSGKVRDVEMDIRHFALSSSGLYQEDNFIGTHGVVRDVTARKYGETKRRALGLLDRAIWSMARADDIHVVLEGIRSALQTVDLSYAEFGVSVIDMNEPPTVQFYSTYKSERVEHKAQWMVGDAQSLAEAIIDIWERGSAVHMDSLNKAGPEHNLQALDELYGPIESIVDVPFSHGVLTITACDTPFSARDLDFIDELASVLSDGFRRVEDLIDLTLSEQRYRRIVETPNLLILLLDTASNFIYVSPQVDPWLGYDPQDFYDDPTHFLNIVHADDKEAATHLLTSHVPSISIEYRWLNRDGTYRWASASSFPIFETDGDAQINRPSLIQIVVQDVDDRKQAEDTIKASLAEKEVLLKEIHHRVKNNLQVISSLLDLQSRRLPSELRNAFEDSQHRINSMALIHEELYNSGDLARIDFSTYAHNLTNNLIRTYSPVGVSLEIRVNAKPLTLEMAIPMGLIINELVSNALKYAFPDNRPGSITVELTSHSADDFVLTVRDDGVGMKEDVDQKTATSLGLKLVHTLAMQLQGRVEVDRESGTAFSIVRSAP